MRSLLPCSNPFTVLRAVLAISAPSYAPGTYLSSLHYAASNSERPRSALGLPAPHFAQNRRHRWHGAKAVNPNPYASMLALQSEGFVPALPAAFSVGWPRVKWSIPLIA